MSIKQQVMDLHRAGMSDWQISKRVGCHPAYIRTVRQRASLPAHKHMTLSEARDALEAILDAKTLGTAQAMAREALGCVEEIDG